MKTKLEWQRAVDLHSMDQIEDGAKYLVVTNGAEWRDVDLHVMRGIEVRLKLRPHYVRGRPVWIAKIVRPDAN